MALHIELIGAPTREAGGAQRAMAASGSLIGVSRLVVRKDGAGLRSQREIPAV
jgi:hypothetical protein